MSRVHLAYKINNQNLIRKNYIYVRYWSMHATNSHCWQGCKACFQMYFVELQLSHINDKRYVDMSIHSKSHVINSGKICWNCVYNQVGLGSNLSLPELSLLHKCFDSLRFWPNTVIDLSAHGLHQRKARKN